MIQSLENAAQALLQNHSALENADQAAFPLAPSGMKYPLKARPHLNKCYGRNGTG